MSAPLRLLARLALALVVGGALYAHVRLIYSGNGKVLYWSGPDEIDVVINSDGSDDVDDGSHFTAIRNAIAEWNAVSGTKASLKEIKNAGEQKSRNWASSSRHLVLFDEDNSSGYFPGSSGIVALTPISFYTNGEIIDADVLFNGKSYGFTTSGKPGRFDVQDVATHELGHLLGLDHTGCAGGTMYPYVDPTVILHRSLSSDDAHGLRAAYPSGTLSKLKGTVRRAGDGSLVRGAWVGARNEEGRLAGAALSGSSGQFSLQALEPGTYTIYASPLDEPVSSGNLTSGRTIEIDFQSTVLGTGVASSGATTELGDLYVGAATGVSLGRVADDYPIRIVAGEATDVLVRGSGLVAGSQLEASDPDVALSSVLWGSSYVSFVATVPGGEAPGHLDLTVTDPGGDRSILCGGLEITPPDPVVQTVDPAGAPAEGGTSLLIGGSGFRPGLRVVLGDRVYSEGANATLVDSGTIALTLAATVPGTHDVVVIDGTGVEGRLPDGFQATAVPVITSVFPEAGASTGGTEVLIQGDNFVLGTTVTIAGIEQTDVTVESLETLRVVTDPGPPGGPYVLTVAAPAGDTAQAAFVYSDKPDPLLADVSPKSGGAQGGESVTVHGANFTPQSEVWFAAGALTGQGGVPAEAVTFIDSNTLVVVTPSCSSKKETVLVQEGDTGQASLLAGAYAFQGDDGSSSGGGGACASVAPRGPSDWREVLSGAGWILVLFACLLLRPRPSWLPR